MEFTQENFDQLMIDLTASRNDTRIQAEARIAEAEQLNNLKAEYETLRSVNDALIAKLEELQEVKRPVDLAKEIAHKKAAILPKDTFEVEGVRYMFVSPSFVFNKEKIIAADVINDTAKLAELVAAKVGTIKKV